MALVYFSNSLQWFVFIYTSPAPVPGHLLPKCVWTSFPNSRNWTIDKLYAETETWVWSLSRGRFPGEGFFHGKPQKYSCFLPSYVSCNFFLERRNDSTGIYKNLANGKYVITGYTSHVISVLIKYSATQSNCSQWDFPEVTANISILLNAEDQLGRWCGIPFLKEKA